MQALTLTPSGKMRNRLELYAPAQVQDPTTLSVPDSYPATPTATRWCAKETIAGQESYRGLQVVAEASFLLKLKYYAGLTARYQLKLGGQVLRILRVDQPDGIKLEHWIWATGTDS